MAAKNKIRPPVVEDYADKSQRQTRTAIQQISVAVADTSGRLIRAPQVYTSSGVYTPPPNLSFIKIKIQAAGGGGGGASAIVGTVSVGAGGASGAYVEAILTNQQIAFATITIGAAGAAGAAAAGTGGTGGDASIAMAGATYTAKGGTGGVGGAQNGLLGVAMGGQVPSGSYSGGIVSGGTGRNSLIFSVAGGGLGFAGDGGAAEMGLPGQISSINSQPSTPAGYGGGGAGASSTNANTAGGAGGPGRIEIEEYS